MALLRLEVRYETGEPELEVVELSERASVTDLLKAIQTATDDQDIYKPRLKGQYGVCAGCKDNCCRQHDITPDYLAVQEIATHLSLSFSEFAVQWLDLSAENPFPRWKKHPCPFLKNDLCSIYEQRALICRLYLCTPMGEDLEQIRAAVSYMGEGALRLRLVEEGLAPKAWTYRALADALRERLREGTFTREQYETHLEQLYLMTERNPFLTATSYEQIALRDCCPDTLWYRLPILRQD